jgi:sigma-B regulation protein RsbU (phosphoserine phosphatase)
VAASLLVAYLHATFRSLAPSGLPLDRLMERANRLICESTLSSNFITLVAGRMTPAGEVELANAGHPHPLLVQAGRIRSIETTGLPLGLFFSGQYRTVRTTMSPGDTLFIYSDGPSQSRNPAMEEYSDARVSAFVAKEQAAAPEELIRRTLADLSSFRGAQPKSDDLTIMALRRLG